MKRDGEAGKPAGVTAPAAKENGVLTSRACSWHSGRGKRKFQKESRSAVLARSNLDLPKFGMAERMRRQVEGRGCRISLAHFLAGQARGGLCVFSSIPEVELKWGSQP